MEQHGYLEVFPLARAKWAAELSASQVPVTVKIELNNNSKGFDLPVDPRSPAGHKLWIVLERMRLQTQAIY